MDLIIAIIFGIVQGLTEFIPVSSSGHLLLLHELFPGFSTTDDLAFDVALHIGTLAAVLIFFWNDVVTYAAAWVTSPDAIRKRTKMTPEQYLSWLTILAIIPAALAGFFLEDWIETILRSPYIVVVMLITVALLFILVERAEDRVGTLRTLKWPGALFVGIAQVLALVPGTSRSGITMLAGMTAGLKREQAARFSFLISIPLIAGAGLKKGLDLATLGVGMQEIPVLLLGTVSAGIVGYIAIAGLLKYLSERSLIPFAIYRIVLGLVVLMIYVI